MVFMEAWINALICKNIYLIICLVLFYVIVIIWYIMIIPENGLNNNVGWIAMEVVQVDKDEI